MIIIGIDPGTSVTGFGIIKCSGRNASLVESHIIKPPSKDNIQDRLKYIYDKLFTKIKAANPDAVALETAFYGKNIQSTLKLGHARGAAILAAANCGKYVFEYSPREIKKAVTGSGAASKQQVNYMIARLLNSKIVQKEYDASDALAAALCHFYRNGSQHFTPDKSFPASWKEFVSKNPHRVKAQ